jgi:hypothetical protein
MTGNDLAVCGEVGFGFGGGASAGGGVGGGMPRDSETFGVEGGLKCGPLGVGLGITLDDCGDLKVKPYDKFGPIKMTPSGFSASSNICCGSSSASTPPQSTPSGGGDLIKCSASAKITGKICRNLF